MSESLKKENLIEVILSQIKTKAPLLIGIWGPMAIGKTTFSLWLKKELTQKSPHLTCSVIHTDGFLWPNHILEKQGILARKGFPESFNSKNFQIFLQNLQKKTQKVFHVPSYDHLAKDVDSKNPQVIVESSVYILEGINLLFKMPDIEKSSSFYDITILLKKREETIHKQFSHRFNLAYEASLKQPKDYFHKHLSSLNSQEVQEYREYLWENIHLPFKKEYIDPYEVYATHAINLD